MWCCQFIDWLKFETRPSSLLNFGMAYNNTRTSLASHSSENSFVLKHECEAKDEPSIVIQI